MFKLYAYIITTFKEDIAEFLLFFSSTHRTYLIENTKIFYYLTK